MNRAANPEHIPNPISLFFQLILVAFLKSSPSYARAYATVMINEIFA